jgi:Tol biopolymer transport system component
MFLWPSWSADGAALAFQANVFSPDARAIYAAEAREHWKPRQIARDLSKPKAWCWDPRSRKVWYVPASGPGGRLEKSDQIVRRFSPKWSGVTQAMAWSPDGGLLACVRSRQGEEDLSLVVMRRSPTQEVGKSVSGIYSRSIVWSPDSRYVLFVRARADHSPGAVCVLDTQTQSIAELHQPALIGAAPQAWVSPAPGEERFVFLDAQGRNVLQTQSVSGPVEEILVIGGDGRPAVAVGPG